LPEVWLFVLGGLFVLVTIALPTGAVGLFARFRRVRHA
jgi:urea transport system permease protein